jgi:hypothetical protein
VGSGNQFCFRHVRFQIPVNNKMEIQIGQLNMSLALKGSSNS